MTVTIHQVSCSSYPTYTLSSILTFGRSTLMELAHIPAILTRPVSNQIKLTAPSFDCVSRQRRYHFPKLDRHKQHPWCQWSLSSKDSRLQHHRRHACEPRMHWRCVPYPVESCFDLLICFQASTGNVCTVRCRNNAVAGPFGGCFAVQQTDVKATANSPEQSK